MSVAENHDRVIRLGQSDIPLDCGDTCGFDHGVFLMINSFETGGTERQFVEVANRLPAHGARVHLGCIQRTGTLLDRVREVHGFGLGGSLYSWYSIRSRFRLARHLRRAKVVVAHAFDFYTNLTLVPAAWMAGIPVIIGSHRQLGDLLTPAQFRAQSAAFLLCDKVVCNSRAAAERLVLAGISSQKIAVIGNGLPSSAFTGVEPAIARVPGIFRVGMIARMNAAYKNHSLFLRAAAKLRNRLGTIQVLIVGDGPLRGQLEQECRDLGIGPQVEFLGERRDIPEILASMDISVIPSDSESLSNVMLESMAAGIPVVATSVGGNTELGDDNRALLIPPNDEEALAGAMQKLLEQSKLRSELAARARIFASENFSLESIGNQYARLYREVLELKGRRTLKPKANSISHSDSRIRVAFIAPTLRYVGGQAVQADLLLRYWANDPKVEARFIPVDPSFHRIFAWIERIPLLRTLCREPLYIYSLWKNLKAVDVAHIFSASYSSFLVAPLPAWLIARLRGNRTLINYRSGECRDHLYKSRIARAVLTRTDLLVAPSGYLIDVFREFGLDARVVPNLVDLSQFSYRVRRPLRPHLVCTRGFHPYYGIDVVVRAFAEIQKTHPDARLDLVGGGPTEAEIRKLVQNLGIRGVQFTGVASRGNIGRYYDQADIFINASHLDNMPVSVLEAFASGTPVISTSPESMRYLVDHGRTGLLSPTGDFHALAQNVLRVLKDSELALKLAENGREESQKFSWNVVRQQWLEVYCSLLSRTGESARELAPIA